jgi:hypothetical protein
MSWWTALFAFLGAAAGAAGAYVAAARGLRQRERQARMEEWGRRFTAALAASASDTFSQRALGREVLVNLAESELSDAEDRKLARAVLEALTRLDDEGDDLAQVLRGLPVDDVLFVEDDDVDEGGRS